MDAGEILRRRLRNQRLVGAGAADPAAIVAWFGAMQAQEFGIAKWSVGQRTVGIDDAAVARALDEGLILRTHALRPTWHFIAAADLRWIQALTGPRVHSMNGPYYRGHGLDAATAARTNAVIVDALRGGPALTRDELAQALAAAGMPATGNRLAYVVMWAELDGLIANGPMRGSRHTYALVEERATVQTELSGDEALAELTRRYFISHGPATAKDFAWWSSLTLTQVRRGLHLVGTGLSRVDVGGVTYWFDPSTVDAGGTGPAAHVLQAYDEYTVAYRESRSLIRSAVETEPPQENASVHSVILDGVLAGVWRARRDGDAIVARLRQVRRLRAGQRRLVDDAFARYAAFAGVPVRVEPA